MGETRKRSKAELLAGCEERGIPAGPINDMAEVFEDPQVQARGMKVTLDGIHGVRAPFTFSDADLKLDAPSPKLGENNG
jgi:crotonobetainyl-CoA:carnitine CoA-transferase CaiB-like acyl-CoA transferase